jgi:hypothetical protein
LTFHYLQLQALPLLPALGVSEIMEFPTTSGACSCFTSAIFYRSSSL